MNQSRMIRLRQLEAVGGPAPRQVIIHVQYIDWQDQSVEDGPRYLYVCDPQHGWQLRGEVDEIA